MMRMNALKHLTLLFVEDQNLLRQAMGDLLAPYCGRLLLATNGREALEIFQRDKPDLVLTDIIMPEMDGITLTEHLSRLSPGTPVVFYSAFSDVPNLLRGIELGVAGFVPKPCDDEKLLPPSRRRPCRFCRNNNCSNSKTSCSIRSSRCSARVPS